MKAVIASALLFAFVLGCQSPRTNSKTVDGRPKVLIKDAPRGSLLHVDGVSMGQADSFNGDPTILLMEPGTHLVEVKVGDRLLFTQRIFLAGSELRTIVVSGETTR